jgi:hypothetical protein
MTPKDKAEQLVEKYVETSVNLRQATTWEYDKQCALIAVELHLEELSKMKLIFSDRELHYKYWQEVKQEIEKL